MLKDELAGSNPVTWGAPRLADDYPIMNSLICDSVGNCMLKDELITLKKVGAVVKKVGVGAAKGAVGHAVCGPACAVAAKHIPTGGKKKK